MAWSLPVGTISLNSRGSPLRSLSSDGGGLVEKTSISFDPLPKSCRSLSLSSDRGLVDYNKSLISSNPFAEMELIPHDVMGIAETVQSSIYDLPTVTVWGSPCIDQDVILRAVDSTKAFLKHVIECEKKTGIVYKALNVMSSHSIFNSCSPDKKLKIMSIVLDRIRNYPQADSREVFLMDVFIRSMSSDDNKSDDITKDEVISRVLDVIQSYPKVGRYKVTEETHFLNDLGFDAFDRYVVKNALYLVFRFDIPEVLFKDSCEDLIDYIYDNRNNMKRMGFERFRKINMIGDVFWPRPSEEEEEEEE